MEDSDRCFTENLRLIGKDMAGKPTDSIAWNLNAGLLSVARQVAALQSELASAQAEIRALRSALQQR